MRTMTAILAALALAGAVRAAETLSPEAELPVHEARDAFNPCAAFGEGVYLVAWQAGRLGEGDLSKGPVMSSSIVACRVGRDGRALEAKPLVVSAASDLREHPQAAFGEKVFLVVWQDLRNGKDWDVYAARVTPEGKCLDPEGVLVSGGKHNQCLPRVTWDGRNFQIVWQDWRSGNRYEVFGARVSAGGKVLEPQGVMLASHGRYHRYAPAAASPGSGKSLLLWLGERPVAGGALLTDGKVADPKAYEHKPGENWDQAHGPGGSCWFVCLAAGPKGYLSAWRNSSPSGRGDGYGGSTAALFDPQGRRVKNLYLSGKKQRIIDPDVAWDGAGFVGVWHLYAKEGHRGCPHEVVQAARVSAEGEPTGQVHAVAGSLQSPASQACVASDGAGTTLVAYERHPKTGDVPIRIAFRMLRAT